MEQITTDPPPDLLTWRTANGLKQIEAAKLLGISQSRYSQIENGLPMRGKLAKHITAVTRVPIEVLVGAL